MKKLIAFVIAVLLSAASLTASISPATATLITYEDDAYTNGDLEYGSDGELIPDIYNIDYVDVQDGGGNYRTYFWVTLAGDVNVAQDSYSWDSSSNWTGQGTTGQGTIALYIDADRDGSEDYGIWLNSFTDSNQYETVNIWDFGIEEYLDCTADIMGSDGPTMQLMFAIDQTCLTLPKNFSFGVNSYYTDVDGNISSDNAPNEADWFDATNPWLSFAAGNPSISGTKKVGKKLTANLGAWSSRATVKYQWYRGTAKISGATKKTYTLSAKDRRKKIRVRVVVSRASYFTVTRYSSYTAAVK